MVIKFKNFLNRIVYSSFVICTGIIGFTAFIAEATTINGPVELSSQEFKELSINGPTTLHDITADSLAVRGPLTFIRLKIKNKTEIFGTCSGENGEFSDLAINGPFDGTRIKASTLKVNGPVAIEDFQIDGNVSINGPMKAKVGSFKDINGVETPVALYDVQVHNINIKKDSGWVRADNPKSEGYGQNNEIKLAGKTVVTGNITFESGNGIVYIRDKTAQFKGKVIGGIIKNSDSNQ